MSLAGPEMEAISIASGSCRGTQRCGQVMNFGICAGRLDVLLEEAVDDAAGRPARERSSQRGRRVVAADHVPVSGHRSRFWAEHERGAQLSGCGATGKHRGDATTGNEP